MPKSHEPRPREIGWREWIALPDLGIRKIKAKIDTGARTTALHAVDLCLIKKADSDWVEFHIPFSGLPTDHRFVAQIIDEREIKNTSGQKERRYIIESTLVLNDRHWRIELSLANRQKMEFEVILGRTALRGHNYLINAGRSFLAGSPQASIMKPKSARGETNPKSTALRALRVTP